METLGSIVGGVGGSLGIFIGFSFWGTILDFKDVATVPNLRRARSGISRFLHFIGTRVYQAAVWFIEPK